MLDGFLMMFITLLALFPRGVGKWLAEVVEAFENYFEEDEDGEGD